MYFNKKEISDIPDARKEFTDAVDTILRCEYKNNILASEEAWVSRSTGEMDMSLSHIQSELIHLAGRYCERFASDLIVTLAMLQAFIPLQYSPTPMRKTIVVGIREDGVDNEPFVVSRLKETITGMNNFVHVEWKYRKLLAIDIQDAVKEEPGFSYLERTVRLIDITHDVCRLEKEQPHENIAC